MTPEHLAREAADAYGNPVRGGLRLRKLYEDIAFRYEDISGLLRRTRGTLAVINLGRQQTRIGELTCGASVFVSSYDPGEPPRGMMPGRPKAAFGAQVIFSCEDGSGHGRRLSTESFGALACDFSGRFMPSFIRHPGCTCEEPWELPSPYPTASSEYPWAEGDSFHTVYSRLMPMITRAGETQAMLVPALQDPSLNPALAARAVDLTMPIGYEIAA